MIGGMKIVPWRQTNAVTPAVTATQTGAGTHNGMALTVKVLTGADILSTGDGSYDYGLVPGASGSANANAPAAATLTPAGTGSWVYGAIGRNNSATAWTAANGSTFIQNVADATNGATYGTFSGGATTVTMVGTPSAPVQVLGVTGVSTNTVTGAWDPTQPRTRGHLLVAVVTAYGTTTAGTITEGSGTWTAGPDVVATSRARTTIWTITAVGHDTAPSFTATNSGTATRALLVCELIELAGQDPVTPVCATGTATGTSAATLTVTTSTGSVPVAGCYAIAGWNIISASGTMTWTPDAAWTGNIDSTGATSTYSHAAFDKYANPPVGATLAATGGHNNTSTYESGAIIVVQPYTVTATLGGVSVTAGASTGDGAAGAAGGVAIYEVTAAGGLAEDPSTPAPVSTTSAKSVTTAHFTPPMGALLVAMCATAGTAVGMQVTDDNGGLDWYEQAAWASGTSGYAGVWTAIVVCR
jgi:hypothetical protein